MFGGLWYRPGIVRSPWAWAGADRNGVPATAAVVVSGLGEGAVSAVVGVAAVVAEVVVPVGPLVVAIVYWPGWWCVVL